ncbi:MAG: YqiA/YcfP family alpha/beta fold hydrolase [Bacteroidota bacterium]
MQILYIHGLDSSPNPDRMGHLERLGHTVQGLHLDYRNTPDSYEQLKSLSVKQGVQFLVGSSLGGMLAFWLGEELGIPCLCFNPAMHVTKEEANIPLSFPHTCPKRWVVLGAEDDTVDPQANWAYFQELTQEDVFQQVWMCQGLGHQIDLPTFEGAARWCGL